jgi:hypothetical protein
MGYDRPKQAIGLPIEAIIGPFLASVAAIELAKQARCFKHRLSVTEVVYPLAFFAFGLRSGTRSGSETNGARIAHKV